MKYERLTKYSEINKDYITPYCDTQNCNGICRDCDYEQVIINRLAELEDKIERGELVDVKENHLIAINRGNGKSSKQLKAIEILTKYENGTLIELPCKVGDTLWYVNKHRPIPRIEENKVHTIDMFDDLITNKFVVRIWTQNGTFYADNMPNVFKTKAEAEQKLKELEK